MHGYIVKDASGEIVMRGEGDPGQALANVDPDRVTWFETKEAMLTDAAVANLDHVRSVKNELRVVNAERSAVAYAAKIVEARRWLAEHPVEDGSVPDESEYPYLVDDCEIEAPATPWDCARAIVAANDSSTRATEKARRIRKKELRGLLETSGA